MKNRLMVRLGGWTLLAVAAVSFAGAGPTKYGVICVVRGGDFRCTSALEKHVAHGDRVVGICGAARSPAGSEADSPDFPGGE